MKKQSRNRWGLALAAATVVLAACGGGGGGGGGGNQPTAPNPLEAVPQSARESVAGFLAYLRILVENPSETREPVTFEPFDPPRPDNTEPAPV